jgi:hypothetical protein
MRVWRWTTGRSAPNVTALAARKTRPDTTSGAPAALTMAATAAAIANGPRKNPSVRISPAANTTATMTQATHSSMS